MGRATFLGQQVAMCRECMPDYTQFSETCAFNPCLNGERPHGADNCKQCPSGTFYNSTVDRREEEPESWKAPRCIVCDKGTFSDWSSAPAIDQCKLCPPGTSQHEIGATKCTACKPGTYQSLSGQSTCEPCKMGGYCDSVDTCGGGYTPCHPGSYNDQEGGQQKSDCISCRAGTFSTKTGADDPSSCFACLPGSFSNLTGQTECTRCPKGMFQPYEGSYNCFSCDAGEYSDAEGLTKCSRCPDRLSSIRKSSSCEFCSAGFYLRDQSVNQSDMFSKPSEHCLRCPERARCPFNTTLQTLIIPQNHWRDSTLTSRLYRCDNSVCRGSPNETDQSRARSSSSSQTGLYCENGHKGPLCEVCVEKNQYFKPNDKCIDCPSLWRLMIPVIVMLGILVFILLLREATSKYEAVRTNLSGWYSFISMLNPQAKVKIFISFCQVMSTLESVYGVQFDSRFKRWFDIMNYFSIDIFKAIGIPANCLGPNIRVRVIMGACSPILIIVTYFVGCSIFSFIVKKRTLNTKKWLHFLNVTIIVLYIALPPVSNTYFEALKCRSFVTNDEMELSISYLVADPQIKCNSHDKQYSRLLEAFWVMFTLWTIIVPFAFLAILWSIRHSIRSRSYTHLTTASRFLWKDYNYHLYYWDLLDVVRKNILTGLIMFIDPEEGSTKLTRLIVAIVISVVYFGTLLLVRPFRKADDLYLCFIANLLLILSFSCGIVLQLCGDDSENKTCVRHIGLGIDSLRATILVVCLSVGMLIITILFLAINASNVVKSPKIRVASSGSKPNLQLPQDCQFHVFISHVWSSGQEKAQLVAKSVKMLNNEMKIWLDVDELQDTSNLEKSVSDSAVFVLFFSKGYFRSRNCRRELYAAVDANKPTVIVYEGDERVLDEIRNECHRVCCSDGYIPQLIISHLFQKDPIVWLGSSARAFAIESIKILSLSILEELPYYQDHPSQLDAGLRVNTELGPLHVTSPTKIIISKANNGARAVAEEAEGTIRRSRTNLIIIELGSNDDLYSHIDLCVPTYMLLYLNADTFVEEEEVSALIKKIHKLDIKIILVHEQDPTKNARPFNFFFEQTPQDLIDQPYMLYRELAVPLYPELHYLKIGLRMVLLKIGATEDSSASRNVRNVERRALAGTILTS